MNWMAEFKEFLQELITPKVPVGEALELPEDTGMREFLNEQVKQQLEEVCN